MYPSSASAGASVAAATNKAAMQRGFMDEMAVLTRFLERYPTAQASITHGFPWRTFLSDDGRGLDRLPDELFAPFATGRCALEVSFPVRVGDVSAIFCNGLRVCQSKLP